MPNKSFKRCGWLLAALPVLTLAQKVDVEFDESADFSRYRTFAIREGKLNSKNPSLNSNLIRKQIDAEIRQRLSVGPGRFERALFARHGQSERD